MKIFITTMALMLAFATSAFALNSNRWGESEFYPNMGPVAQGYPIHRGGAALNHNYGGGYSDMHRGIGGYRLHSALENGIPSSPNLDHNSNTWGEAPYFGN